tara:strand:+ start:351 stop:587 length:237 start_codon:yes stop_codon:yes gene_type:complete
MALAIGTYEPKAGIAGEVRAQLEAQFGAPDASGEADAEKLVVALATALHNVLTGSSAYGTANAAVEVTHSGTRSGVIV